MTTSYSYNKDRRDNLLAEPKLPGGDDKNRVYYAFVVSKAELSPCKNDEGMSAHDIRVHVQANPLKNYKDPNDAFGPPVKDWIRIPIANPLVAGHVGPESLNITKKACAYATAFWGEKKVPAWPVWDKGLQKLMFKGKPITQKEEAKAQAECIDAAIPLWVEALGEPGNEDHSLKEELNGRIFFAGLRYGKDKYKDKPFLFQMTDEKPKTWKLKTDNLPLDGSASLPEQRRAQRGKRTKKG